MNYRNGNINNNYFYDKNLQGDIIALTDVDRNIVVEYTYDAWGEPTSATGSMASTLGAANPFLYRGYYFEPEFNLYYLQSRYYSPVAGRFLNADSMRQVNGSNLFVYCGNNPIMFVDPQGNMAVSALRMLSKNYTNDLINSSIVSYCVLALNGMGLYLAFHEMAQIFIAKVFSQKRLNVTLEYSIPGIGEADIVANGAVWEVKPLKGESPEDQLKLYTKQGTGLVRGYHMDSITAKVMDGLKMVITFGNSGQAYYCFYNTKTGSPVKNVVLYNAIKDYILAGCGAAGIIIATAIASDILTGGIAIPTDALYLVAASATMAEIIDIGLENYGIAA